MKILVVDDSATIRKLIGWALDGTVRPDEEVLEAADAMQALVTIAHHGPSIDLIFCDMNMPNLDGLALLTSVRGSPEFRHIPFVIMTADESDERTARALREGAAGVIGKPFRPEVIAALIREKRSSGRRVTSSGFSTDAVTGMIQTMSRPERPLALAGSPARPAV